ncbi:GspE/PulE family protein [Thermodesulfobacteriota bacterium]
MDEKRRRCFDYLIDNNIISEIDLMRAKRVAEEKKTSLESILIKEMDVPKEEVGRAYGEYYQCEYVPFDGDSPVPYGALTILKEPYLRQNLWVPLSDEGGSVKILINDPKHDDTIENIRTLLAGKDFEFVVGLEEDIHRFLDHFFGTSPDEDGGSIDDILEMLTDEEDIGADEFEELEEGEVVTLVNKIIIDAYGSGASVIHIEPAPEEEVLNVRLRIDGVITPYLKIPFIYCRPIAARLKIMAAADVTERYQPQYGRIRIRNHAQLNIDLRIASIPTYGGHETITLHFIKETQILSLDEIGLSPDTQDRFLNVLKNPHGIVIVCGPPSSGTSTTLHAAVAFLNTETKKIWTIEDPITFLHKGVSQAQIRPKNGFTYAAAFRASFRGDPDVIMVGEANDEETMSLCIEAALHGQLVLSTFKANSALECIHRLLKLEIDPVKFSDSLLCIISQRLVRNLCPDCSQQYHPSKEEYDMLVKEYGENAFEKNLSLPHWEDLEFKKAGTCTKCHYTGYRGRTGLFEILLPSSEFKALIENKVSTEELKNQVVKDDMMFLKQNGIEQIFKGEIDLKQIKKICF